MAPRSDDFNPAIVSRIPTNRKPMNTVDDWLDGKRVDDGAEGLWRIHDKLYDFTTWMKNHPGGKEWLEISKGTDITEAFECNHITLKPENMLKKFYVRDAKTPRNSLITFHEKGFFRTFKRKIRERKLLTDTKPLPKTKFFTDALAVSVFVTALLATTHNFWWALVSGILLNMLAVCAHNFFHMKDNWRMHYFNLLLMSIREWRVSHVLSHHLYPNTVLDLEISMFEPFFQFLPKKDKKLRYLSYVFCPLIFSVMCHFQFGRRIVEVLSSKKLRLHWEELICFSLFYFMILFGGKGVWDTFVIWNEIILFGSFFFSLVGLTAAHHHPDIYHDGDFLGNDKDFGILQIAAVRNRIDVDGNFMKTMVMFGDHALHHMLPTVDHGRLHELDDVLAETCKEFNIKYEPFTSSNLFKGMFQQLIRNYTNLRLMVLEN